jgi:hypothetical protein
MVTRTPLRIAVTGLAATYPFGGVFWDYVQYALGFLELGHDVLYIEDTGRWCYDPVAETFTESGENNARHLQQHLARLDERLVDRWFYRDAREATYGRPWADVVEFCRGADLFLHISASCWMRDEYFAADRTAFIDSDPMYTQASIPDYLDGTADDEARQRVEMLRSHDVFFTFGERLGAADCRVPAGLFDWQPTRQPIVMPCFDTAARRWDERRRVLTTVASWEPAEAGPVVDGVKYRGKSVEFERFIDLPSRSPVPIELAISGNFPRERWREHGWKIREGYDISRDPWVYRDYLADSLAEWSVAKNAYVAGRTGWFSCRTACYLALGVPAVVQQTGFPTDLPTGEGLIAFDTLEEAAAGIEELARDPARHASAARQIAQEHFDSQQVLTRLLEQASASRSARVLKEAS